MTLGNQPVSAQSRPITRLLLALALAGALWLSGCASERGAFTASKESNYEQKLQHLLIVYYHQELPGQLGGDYGKTVVTRLADLLRERGIPSEACTLPNPDDSAILKQTVAQTRPQQVLYLMVTKVEEVRRTLRPPPGMEYTSASSGNPHEEDASSFCTFSLSFRLDDLERGKSVWKGDAQFETVPSAEKVARQLYEELAKAGLL